MTCERKQWTRISKKWSSRLKEKWNGPTRFVKFRHFQGNRCLWAFLSNIIRKSSTENKSNMNNGILGIAVSLRHDVRWGTLASQVMLLFYYK